MINYTLKDCSCLESLWAAFVICLSFALPAIVLADGKAPSLLPSGYLSTKGNQIVDSRGRPIRIACIGGFGDDADSGLLDWHFPPYLTVESNLAAIKAAGFNCLRVDFNDQCVDDAPLMAQFDHFVAVCKFYGLKVIFDHHNDEATAADWGNAAQQTNGLWYDSGPGSDGTDDAGDKGTITNEKFTDDWVKFAKRYAGNSTVIGFDLDNEPHIGYGTPNNGESWGGGGAGDICAMYTIVGNAIETVDPGALIICEGLMDNTDKGSLTWWMMDLSHVTAHPVVLMRPHKVVYSVHEYPNLPDDSGPAYIARLNVAWGFLVAKNIAPVWIGEMGSSLNQADGNVQPAEQKDWATTLLAYMNGVADGGPRFTKGQQPISGDWWAWGNNPTYSPDGCFQADGSLKPEQKPFIEQMLFRTGQRF